MTNDLGERRAPGLEQVYNPGAKTGASAKSLLSTRHFKRLVVEIVAVQGRLPTDDATNHFRSFLEKTLGKPRGVDLYLTEIPSSGLAAYAQPDIRRLEEMHRRYRTRLDQISVFVLFLDGKSANSAGSIRDFGRSYRNTSMVIFEDTLREAASNGEINPWALEATVLEHEFGHLLGLVGLASPSPAGGLEPSGNNHCPNPACLMHKTAFSPATLPILKADAVPPLDSACQEELRRRAQD